MKRHLKSYWGAYTLLGIVILAVATAVIYNLTTVPYPSTAKQALTGCADYGGVRSITDPGSQGAYVVCLDGRKAFHTQTGRHGR